MKRLAELRILMTADAVGGVWTYAAALASALASQGADVHLVIQGAPPSGAQRSMISNASVRLIESPLALEWQDPEAANVEAARHFYAALEAELRPHIVHLNSFREAAFDWRCPVLVVAHSCVNSWALACDDTAWLADRKWQRYTELVARGLDRAPAWVCPTRAFRDIMLELYHPRTAGSVIWNGIAEHPLDVDIGDKDAVILAAGRMWDAAKNLSVLARAAQGLNSPVLVAGPAGDRASGSSVHQLGALSHKELRQLMRRAAIFASPARYEPFGLSVLEAASAGCALVLADIPTFRELWHDAAVFVDPTDAGALHRALAELSADDPRRGQLQQAARARSQRYSLRRMVGGYATLYENLLMPDANRNPTAAVEVFA
jgi:glycosyltransferase involved in cell wall biosynthesis